MICNSVFPIWPLLYLIHFWILKKEDEFGKFTDFLKGIRSKDEFRQDEFCQGNSIEFAQGRIVIAPFMSDAHIHESNYVNYNVMDNLL